MGTFVRLLVDIDRCDSACARCATVCPVDVFRREGPDLLVDAENEDECTLCDLCLDACPFNALRLIRVYDEE